MKNQSVTLLSRISRNFLFLFIARLFDILGRFAIIPIIARYLGEERLGDYGYALAFAFIAASITYIGVERIAIREISNNRARAGRCLGTALITRWIYMAGTLALMAVLIRALNLPSDVALAVSIAVLSLNFYAETVVYQAVFKAFEEMQYETYLTLVFQVFHIIFVGLTVYFKLGFVMLFGGFLTANLIRTVLAVWMIRRRFAPPVFRLDIAAIKAFVKESYVLGLFGLCMQAFLNADILLLKALTTTRDASMFYASHNLIVLISIIPLSLMSGLFPALSVSAKENSALLFYQYEKAFRSLTMLSVFLAVLFFVFPRQIIALLYGRQFLDAAPGFQILAFAVVFTMLFAVFDFTLVAVEKQNILLVCPLAGLAVKVALNLLLVPNYGYIGAAVASLCGYAALFCAGFLLTSRYVGVLAARRVFLKPAAAAGLVGLCLFPFSRGGIGQTLFLSGIGLGGYSLCLAGFKFFLPDEIIFLKTVAQKVTHKRCGNCG